MMTDLVERTTREIINCVLPLDCGPVPIFMGGSKLLNNLPPGNDGWGGFGDVYGHVPHRIGPAEFHVGPHNPDRGRGCRKFKTNGRSDPRSFAEFDAPKMRSDVDIIDHFRTMFNRGPRQPQISDGGFPVISYRTGTPIEFNEKVRKIIVAMLEACRRSWVSDDTQAAAKATGKPNVSPVEAFMANYNELEGSIVHKNDAVLALAQIGSMMDTKTPVSRIHLLNKQGW